MPKFVIEREVPGAGNLTDAQIREISQKSNKVLKEAGLRHPMDPKLRHRRQGVLRLHRA